MVEEWKEDTTRSNQLIYWNPTERRRKSEQLQHSRHNQLKHFLIKTQTFLNTNVPLSGCKWSPLVVCHNILDFENYQPFFRCLFHFSRFESAYPHKMNFIGRKRNGGIGTRASTRGDCEMQKLNMVSHRGMTLWKKRPVHVRNCKNGKWPVFV